MRWTRFISTSLGKLVHRAFLIVIFEPRMAERYDHNMGFII